MERVSGILMPVFSLPSKYGIGDFGSGAYKFIDFLKKSNQKLWQILPLVQTGFGNSPYSSVSSKSFSPYFISPEILLKKGLIKKSEIEFLKYDGERIDYSFLFKVRFPMLKKAFSRFDKTDKNYQKYIKSKSSLDYALFMTIKEASGQKHFYEWEDCYKLRDQKALKKFKKDYAEEVEFMQFIQYEASVEWQALKKYANENGISIIGDLPLYSALDSVDVWTNPNLYKLDQNFMPKKVAGVPPDYFSKEGQLWGNPVYDYDYQSKDDFSWWTKRIKSALKYYDYIRIDHFRGLDRFYEIDADAKTAMNGSWVDVPSDQLFSAIHKVNDKTKIIAEDLGIIDDGVRNLIKKLNYPGMNILSFAFNGDENNLYLPKNVIENSITYTGTHDNDTLLGLIYSFNDWDYDNIVNGVKSSLENLKMKVKTDTHKDLVNAIIELGFKCKSKAFIMPMQDLLNLDGEYRINTPGTVSPKNWSVRFKEKDFSSKVSNKLKKLSQKYGRN